MEIPSIKDVSGTPTLVWHDESEVTFTDIHKLFEWLEGWLNQLLEGMPRMLDPMSKGGQWVGDPELSGLLDFLVEFCTTFSKHFESASEAHLDVLHGIQQLLAILALAPFEKQPVLEVAWLVSKHYLSCSSRIKKIVALANIAAWMEIPRNSEPIYTITRLNAIGCTDAEIPMHFVYLIPYSPTLIRVIGMLARLYGHLAPSRAEPVELVANYYIAYDAQFGGYRIYVMR